MRRIVLFLTILALPAYAQITLTNGDLANIYAVGNQTTGYFNVDLMNVDIGTPGPGGGNNWDFSNLSSGTSISYEVVDAASSPYISDFPGANVCIYSAFNFIVDFEVYNYFSLSSNSFDEFGEGETNSLDPDPDFEKIDPFKRIFSLPMTLNTQWSSSYVKTIIEDGNVIATINISSAAEVDAFGMMTMPGGSTLDALRIKESLDIDGIPSVKYHFISLNGAIVSLEAEDSNPPNSGVIAIEGYDYNEGYITVGVENTSSLPEEYYLKQNYPNPFNPSTTIEYNIPEESFVELEVFNVLGSKVATLVSENQNAGAYRVDFNAADLASGIYIARIRTGNFISSVKMELMK